MESWAGETQEEKVRLGQNLGERQQHFQAGDNWGGKSTDLAQWADSPETLEP